MLQGLWFMTEPYRKPGDWPLLLMTLMLLIWIAANTVFLQLANSNFLHNWRWGESLGELLHLFALFVCTSTGVYSRSLLEAGH